MTVEEYFHDQLTARMLYDNEADEIIEEAKKSNVFANMVGRWQHDVKGYNKMMLVAMWVSIRDIALNWIQKNKPDFIFTSMFQG